MQDGERYAEAKRIFLEAVEMPRSERAGFVEARCVHDAALGARVRRMLTADDDGEFLGAGAVVPSPVGLPAGTVLGRYRIVRALGEGGMGIVYEAEQDEPARRVALKIIHPHLLSDRLRSRFRHEIRALGQLRHPGIAQIYDAGTLEVGGGRVPYFAMELVAGRPLLECATAINLDVRGRLELVAQVCDAVHHAHQKGVVHRDLKPANILVEESRDTTGDAESGRPPLQIKVLDFGVARVTDADVRAVTIQTSAHQLVGTVPYMSPEQAGAPTRDQSRVGTPAADPEGVDIRTDVYSIGVIAFELLAGRLPHPVQGRGLHEAVRAIREDEPARLGSIDRSLRGDIDTVVAKALEKDRERRYGSAAELAADIRRFLRDEPIAARPPSALYHLRMYARRHKPLVIAAGIALAAMVAATAVSTWQALVAERARGAAESQRDRADRNAAEARREADRAGLAAAAAAIGGGDPITARRLLDGTEDGARGWAWRYWDARLDQCIASIDPGAPVAGAWLTGPGGDEITIVTNDGLVRVWDPWRGPRDEGEVRLACGPVSLVAPFDDGRRLAGVSALDHRGLYLLDRADGRVLQKVTDLPAWCFRLTASANGSVIAAALREGNYNDVIWAWDGAGGGADALSISPRRRLGSIALSADGRRLAHASDFVEFWDSRARDRLGFVHLGWGVAHVDLTADGRRAVTGGQDKLVRLWDVDTCAPVASLRGHSGDITAVAFDPAGRAVASAAADLTIRLWDAAAGAPRAVLAGLSRPVWLLRFSDDGSRLLSVADDGAVHVWVADPDAGVSVLRGHESYVYGVAFAPDGSRIISGAWDEALRFWDAAGGECLRVVPTGSGYVSALALSRDGRIIATGHSRGWWTPGPFRLWDAATGEPLGSLPPARTEPLAIAFAPGDNRLVVATRESPVEARDLGAGAAADPVPGFAPNAMPARSVAFSLDGAMMAIGHEDGVIRLWDWGPQSPTSRLGAPSSGQQEIRRLEGHRGEVHALAFRGPQSRPSAIGGPGPVGGGSPHRLLASGGADGTVRLWEADTGRCLAALERHWDRVYAVAFSPDGSILASGSNDTTIRIWDVATGEETTQLRGHDSYVYALAFSPDGRMLVSGSGDGTVRVWDTRPVRERWRARAQPAR